MPVSTISHACTLHASLTSPLPVMQVTPQRDVSNLKISSLLCLRGEGWGRGKAVCWWTCLLCVSFTIIYSKTRTAEPGNPSSSLLLVRGGWEELLSRGCTANPPMALGKISISEARPSSMVVFKSWSSRYLLPTCKNKKCPLLPGAILWDIKSMLVLHAVLSCLFAGSRLCGVTW